MNKIVVTRNIGERAHHQLHALDISFSHNQADVSWNRETLVVAAAEAEAIICLLSDKIDAAVLDALPELRLIANVAVGYDNIDVAAASERGIMVTNTPDVLTETTADLTFALLLALARRLPESDRYMRAGKYQRFELFPDMLGGDVYGKTLGIIGLGRIGTAVAQRAALGFKMPILYWGRQRHEETERTLGARFVSFEALLQQSDFISINVALTEKTKHLFTYESFRQMKETAFIINSARGPVIHEADLVRALKEGLIGGAALDVFEFEPDMVEGLATIHNRLIVTPHIGSATIETRQKMAQIAVENVVAYFSGKRPLTLVNPDAYKSS